MNRLTNKHVLLGVTGGIAAYKAAELARLLCAEGADVRVVMTQSATSFVAPLTFQALTGNAVHLDLLNAQDESAMDHVRLARWADIVLIAPATANIIAKLRTGAADDLLTTLCLVSTAPLCIAPAMNHAMWNHAATAENVAVLQSRGATFFGPAPGQLACGETGLGRLLDPVAIVDSTSSLLAPKPMSGLSVLISAGPTREPIDPIRFISNRSSGKMGYAIAAAAAALGANVTLISGPTVLEDPHNTTVCRVETAHQMHQAVLMHSGNHDIYIGTAAVADYTPTTVARNKIKKTSADMTIELERTQDILSAVALSKTRPFTVGFAAETENVEKYAKNKLQTKHLDMIAANLVGQAIGGFESEQNALAVYWPGGERHLALTSKREIAKQLMEIILERFHEKNSTQDS